MFDKHTYMHTASASHSSKMSNFKRSVYSHDGRARTTHKGYSHDGHARRTHKGYSHDDQ